MNESPILPLLVEFGASLVGAVVWVVGLGLFVGAPIFGVYLVFRFFKRLMR